MGGAVGTAVDAVTDAAGTAAGTISSGLETAANALSDVQCKTLDSETACVAVSKCTWDATTGACSSAIAKGISALLAVVLMLVATL